MSGAADDDSAPSNSTPQTPEGTEGAPDVTVTESKPDTPGSHTEEDDASKNDASENEPKTETPTEQATEDVKPAIKENDEPANGEKTEKKTESDTGDETAKVEEEKPADGEGAQNASEESPSAVVEEERKCEPAPETGETECVMKDDAEPLGEVNEAQPNENEKGDSVESKQAEEPAAEPAKEDGETEGVVVTDDSTKDEGKVDEVGSVDKDKSENESGSVKESAADEGVNAKDNNDVAEGTAQNADAETPTNIPESGTGDTKSNEGDTAPETEDPVTEASNSENVANEPAPTESVEDTQRAEENPQSNKDDGAAIVNTNTGDAPSNPEERTEHANVEISELDSVKLENERLMKRVKELEDEIDRIREGRKEGMKVQADYLARELSQTQDTEKYLREKLAEVLQEKEESERRVKDMQLRLKRFAKDDQAKDARLAKMEKELREITHEVQILENMLDADTLRSVQEQRASGKVNGPSGAGTGTNKGTAQPPPPQSKTCVIL